MFTYFNQQPFYQHVRLAGSFRCWFVKKYCWLVCVREKYCFSWKFMIVYDEPQPNEQAEDPPLRPSSLTAAIVHNAE